MRSPPRLRCSAPSTMISAWRRRASSTIAWPMLRVRTMRGMTRRRIRARAPPPRPARARRRRLRLHRRRQRQVHGHLDRVERHELRARLGGEPKRRRGHLVGDAVLRQRQQDRAVLDFHRRPDGQVLGHHRLGQRQVLGAAVDDVDDHPDREPDDADRRHPVTEVQGDGDQPRCTRAMRPSTANGAGRRSRPGMRAGRATACRPSRACARIWITEAWASVNESIAPNAYRLPRKAIAPGGIIRTTAIDAVEDDRD